MRYWVLVAIYLLGGLQSAAAGETRGFILASSCFNCHGPGGMSKGSIPDISALSATQIATALKAFRDGSKEATVMDRLARGYADDEVAAIAQWFEHSKAAGKSK